MAALEERDHDGRRITVTRRAPTIGAEVQGLDLARVSDEESIELIRKLWLEHHVLVFPGQRLSEEAQVAFSRHFGELAVFHDQDKISGRRPEILRVANVDENGEMIDPDHPVRRYFALLTSLWHTDGSYKALPSLGSMLHALEVPPEGGETWFADMAAAFEALPEDLAAAIEGRHMVHSHNHTRLFAPDIAPMTPEDLEYLPPVTHPLVRRHDDGRRSLFLSENVAYYVGGMAIAEGQALHRRLMDHATRPEFVYRHRWAEGDVVMWDNRFTMHRVTPYDARHHRRVMQWTEIKGAEPVR